MKILTFIPARGGSRSIKNKNIIKINNKPLITHTIDFVKKFPKMDWFVSTDNREIFKIVKKKGFKFNYIRSKKIIDIFWNYKINKKGIFWSNECSYKEVKRILDFLIYDKKSQLYTKVKNISKDLMVYNFNNSMLRQILNK